MEKKEIRITEDALTEAMVKATDEVVNKIPQKNMGDAAQIVLLAGIFCAELIDVLFGGGYRPQLMRRVAYDFAR